MNRLFLLGSILWISSVQYFIVQLIVASSWPHSHSWANNYISDLGNTTCGVYDGLYVCSPLHMLMNASFVLFGSTMALGSVLFFLSFRRTTVTLIGFSMMVLSGLGTILVGLFPENTISQMHQIGAFFGLVVGNLSILVLAGALRQLSMKFRIYSAMSATVSLVAFALFFSEIYLGIGKGGMERLVSYPFTIWMISFGVYTASLALKSKKT